MISINKYYANEDEEISVNAIVYNHHTNNKTITIKM